MKKLIKLVAVLLVLLVLATIAVALYIDTIAKTAIERGATYALGVKTTLGSADVGLLSGTFSMGDLTVANPAGFKSPYFTHLGEGDVKVALKTLRQETVELPTLTLTNLDIHLEKKEGEANYDVILENLSRFESGDELSGRLVLPFIGGMGDAVAMLPIVGALRRRHPRWWLRTAHRL